MEVYSAHFDLVREILDLWAADFSISGNNVIHGFVLSSFPRGESLQHLVYEISHFSREFLA